MFINPVNCGGLGVAFFCIESPGAVYGQTGSATFQELLMVPIFTFVWWCCWYC
jgi:hypothetical protein